MEKELLDLIEHNAKLSLEEIACSLGVTIDAAASMVADLEKRSVICGYNTIIDWGKVTNEKCNALIEVKVIPQRGTGFDRIANRIAKFQEVDSVYLLSGGYDFMVVIEGRSMKEVSSFVFDKLATIEFVQSTATHFVLKKYKDHGELFAGEQAHKRTNVIL